MSVLRGKDLVKVYGGKGNTNSTTALNGIDIDIAENEFVGVMGPSGSGKTTLLQVLSGIARPSTGEVEIDGRNLAGMDKNELALFRRRKLGFIFQEFNLLDSLTLRENIMLPMVLDMKDGQSIEEKLHGLMTGFDIMEISDKYPYNVSGGQQQRAAVCRALVNDPVIVFADEPTGNLDSKSSRAVMECFDKMNRENNTTVLFVTHDPFAASYCKRIVFIKDGTICMEINRKADRKEFFDRILDCLAVIGGEKNDLS